MRFAGKTAIVVGAAGGIGSEIARGFAAEGADLALVDCVSADAAHIKALGRKVMAFELDITRKSVVDSMVRATVDQFGHVDILVNAAGVVSFGAAASLAEAEWDRVLAINLKGVFLTCQAVIPAMRKRRGGRIVNIGSIIGKNGGNARPWVDPSEQDRASNIAYGASKAGVHSLTLFFARELANDGITVNAVAPGPIKSAMTTAFPEALKAAIPVGRMGTAADVAEAVKFLASDAASFITGEIMDVNGGMWGD
jgi:3-oxoacyl-[acyl-carrier protein] reductase